MCLCVCANERIEETEPNFLFSLIRNTNERVAGTHMPQHWCVYNNNNNNNSNAISSDDANKIRIQFFVDHVPRTGVKSSKIRERRRARGRGRGKNQKRNYTTKWCLNAFTSIVRSEMNKRPLFHCCVRPFNILSQFFTFSFSLFLASGSFAHSPTDLSSRLTTSTVVDYA